MNGWVNGWEEDERWMTTPDKHEWGYDWLRLILLDDIYGWMGEWKVVLVNVLISYLLFYLLDEMQ